jgi:hypothetical protein
VASPAEMRDIVKNKAGQFPKQWAEKVDKMSDNQVLAIYLRMKNQGKL